ncbi:DUF4231 domain-containing protein [Paraburkholderia sp. UCT2]|uniref:DUF4231 domain-containing protein n=1 Tax=Paraburkholderia sp. UCT2 TaxID=2615208 RepID=UPI001654C432|nr:DUF4231 domain-containing protein [Paraburkholderia sp. UCT2]MBC8733457.1 DUF4231 domain-containing protein [Paraburkholderia sp. UCT2]
MSEESVANIWRRRIGWSRAADRLKARINYARNIALVLSVCGATSETVAATFLADVPSGRTALSALGAVFLAIATFVTARLLTVDAIRSWTRARSVSEALKAEIYSFRANAAPYACEDRLKILLDKTDAVQAAAQDLERYVANVEVGSASPPPTLTRDEYISKRVEQQINGYYRKKAKLCAKRLDRLRAAEFVLGLAGTALSAVATGASIQASTSTTFHSGISAWVAVCTTLGAAIAAHIAANRYDFLVVSYYGTARRLEDLVNRLCSARDRIDSESWTNFVRDCEAAISVENESWLAKWMEKEPGGK